MAYATQADLTAYSEGIVIDDPDAVDRELERATQDVDNYVGGAVTLLASGRRFDLTDVRSPLSQAQKDAVTRATCAQTEFRLFKGPEYFIDDEPGVVEGPDFTINEGTRRWFSSKAARELRTYGVVLTGARAVP